MSSGITFSGFNSIDFNVVLSAIMTQESAPLTALQSRQTALTTRSTQLNTFSARLTSLQNAATALSTSTGTASYKSTSSDSTAVSVSSTSSAVPGRYDIVVNELARAQVSASANAAPDAETTTIATGGSITIGGKTVTLTGATTLRQLSEAINADADVPARASVVQSGTNAFKLVLTAKSTGQANAFTITDNMTGGAFDLNFADADNDGVSGDSVADNAVQATDAQLTINNVAITSASNTLDAAVPGSSITLFKKDSANPIVVEVTEDQSALKTRLQTFANAYNAITSFITDQQAAKTDGAIGRDPLVRSLRNELRATLGKEFSTGSTFKYLSQIGVEISRTGTMEIKDSVFDEALKSGSADIGKLLAGTDAVPGALKTIANTVKQYTQAQGFLQSAQAQITDQQARLSTQVNRMQDRLALRRAALQQEFTAADAAMSQLKNQSGSLSNVSL